jgi:hypothetical protein
MKNLMLIGKMCSGKTTIADALVADDYEVISLADPIKGVVWGMANGLSMVDLLQSLIFDLVDLTEVQKEEFIKVAKETAAIESGGPKYRERLQFFGTEGGRDRVDKDIWIKCLLAKVQLDPKQAFVIDDCRFINEYEILKEHFSPIILHVARLAQQERLVSLYGSYAPKILTHASELDYELIKARADEGKCIHINSGLPLPVVMSALAEKIKGLI